MLKTKLVSLKSIVNKLSKLKSTHSIILIGSFADGVEDESSDIDLFVVTDDISIDQVKEILYSNDYTCDSPLILTQKELIDELEKGNPNIVHYIKAGKIIKDSGLIEKIKNEKIVFSYESLIKSLEDAEEDLKLALKYSDQKFVARAIAKASMAELIIHEEPYTSIKMGLRCIERNHGLSEVKKLEEVYKKLKKGEYINGLNSLVEKIIGVVKNEAKDLER